MSLTWEQGRVLVPVLACGDRSVKVVENSEILYTAELPGPPTTLQLFYNDGGESGEQVLYTDCADINFQVSVSNTKDFAVQNKSMRGTHNPPGACAGIHIIGLTPGAVTTVSVTFTLPGSGTELKETLTVSVYE